MTDTSLSSKQMKFALMVAELIKYAGQYGYGVTFGETYRPPETCELYARQGRGIPNSLHAKRLAVDLNVFDDGKYCTDAYPYHFLHDYWDLLGGAERIAGDLNHFSLEHEGVR